MREVWKYIPNSNVYEASTHGRFRRNGELIKTYTYYFGGYPRCRVILLDYMGKPFRGISAGRMVLLTFIGKPPKGKNVTRHLDDDVSNNRLDNLEWGSYRDNAKDAQRNRRVRNAVLLRQNISPQ